MCGNGVADLQLWGREVLWLLQSCNGVVVSMLCGGDCSQLQRHWGFAETCAESGHCWQGMTQSGTMNCQLD